MSKRFKKNVAHAFIQGFLFYVFLQAKNGVDFLNGAGHYFCYTLILIIYGLIAAALFCAVEMDD